MLGWGLVTVCTVAIHSYGSLMVIRVFIGVSILRNQLLLAQLLQMQALSQLRSRSLTTA
jgi:hypothetical protein